MQRQSRHRSLDVLSGYVQSRSLFVGHAGQDSYEAENGHTDSHNLRRPAGGRLDRGRRPSGPRHRHRGSISIVCCRHPRSRYRPQPPMGPAQGSIERCLQIQSRGGLSC